MKITLFHFVRRGVYSDGFKWTRHYYCIVDSWGIWFKRKGDEVCWKWPWFRKPYADGSGTQPWFVSGLGEFPTLKSIDEFWKGYWEYCEQQRKEDLIEQA